MIVRQVFRQIYPPPLLARAIGTSAQSPPGFPPILQKTAEKAVQIMQSHVQKSSATSSSTTLPLPSTSIETPPIASRFTSPPPVFPSSIGTSPPPPPTSTSRTLAPLSPSPLGGSKPGVAYTRSQVFIASKTDPVLGLLTNLVMRHGLLHRARKTVAECLLYIQSQTHSDPLPFVKEAIRRASPSVRVVSHKRGAKIIRVPLPLSERQRTRTGIMWILEAAEKRMEMKFFRRIAWEMIDIMNSRPEKKSAVVTQKEKLHEEAAGQRANALMGRGQ